MRRNGADAVLGCRAERTAGRGANRLGEGLDARRRAGAVTRQAHTRRGDGGTLPLGLVVTRTGEARVCSERRGGTADSRVRKGVVCRHLTRFGARKSRTALMAPPGPPAGFPLFNVATRLQSTRPRSRPLDTSQGKPTRTTASRAWRACPVVAAQDGIARRAVTNVRRADRRQGLGGGPVMDTP
jgi:hypothetical protein